VTSASKNRRWYVLVSTGKLALGRASMVVTPVALPSARRQVVQLTLWWHTCTDEHGVDDVVGVGFAVVVFAVSRAVSAGAAVGESLEVEMVGVVGVVPGVGVACMRVAASSIGTNWAVQKPGWHTLATSPATNHP
jgi:hypothetical protein